MDEGIKEFHIHRQKDDQRKEVADQIAEEAPLEIQVQHFGEESPTALSVTMRTPGDDEELALGFLFTEGLLQDYTDVRAVSYTGDNIVKVYLNEGVTIELNKAERNFYTTSSCGVCGKASIDAIKTTAKYRIELPENINGRILYGLKDQLTSEQSLFSMTGGIHAAAIFDLNGKLEAAFEDVGRHNAMDKLVGHYFKQGKLPLTNKILLLSGRASFELVQKATMAGIGYIVAVGAPSSLAVELARDNQQCLVGFLKQDSFNIYCEHDRIN